MKTRISSVWQGNLAFVSTVGDHSVRTDAGIAIGGENSGASPKMLMMVALSGCTGVDVAAILKKMRVDIDSLEIIIEGELTDDSPSVFSSMHIVYRFAGGDLPLDKLERAVRLSMDSYCGVSAMYRRIMDITWEIRTDGKDG